MLKKGGHIHYALFVNGLQTPIKTWVSKGSDGEELGRKLLGYMADQVKLDFPEFLRLIDGDMDHEEYVQSLRDRGFLK